MALIVFTESGLPFGFFLPGDSLLFAAGIFSAQGHLPIVPLISVIAVTGIAGYWVGYHIGTTTGPKIFRQKDGLLFRHEYLEKTEKFIERHGAKTIMFARFIAIARTFAPIMAGMGKMPKDKFMFYNVAGALFWASSVTLIGYWFGAVIPDSERFITYFIVAAVILTLAAPLVHIARDPKSRRRLAEKFKK